MSRRGDEIVRRARKLIGVRFRPQGRDPEHGLDCIGVVAMATGMKAKRVRRDYLIHSSNPDEINRNFDRLGFIRIAPNAAEPGDVLLVRPNPTALHLVLLSDIGYIHADMRARRTVEVPGAVPWPTLSAWRDPVQAAEDPLAPELAGPPSVWGLH